MPQQIADLLERCAPGEIVDVVTVIGEHSAIAVEVTDRRCRRDDVFEPGLRLLSFYCHSETGLDIW
jgi:hypothetical protein